MSNQLGKQGHHTTTAERLARYVGASHGGKAHRGLSTGLGGNRVSGIPKPPTPQRMADRCDCEHYEACLDVAARTNSKCVCSSPCGRFVPMSEQEPEVRSSNYPIVEDCGRVL